MWFWLSLIALLCWSGSDLFSKIGCRDARDKYSHLKMVMAVGVVMGLHAAYEVFVGGTVINLDIILTYLPVSILYILSMAMGYVGLRYIELSISSPICNSSGALVAVLAILFDGIAGYSPLALSAVALVCVGAVGLGVVEVREDDEEFKNPVDLMFDALEAEKPHHFAVRQYKKYKLAAGKTAKSILISCGARLAVFDIAELREVTAYDELELDTLGDRKTALFLIMSDTDDSFNFLISMCYTQLFNLLCEKADDVYGGRLPVHVRCLIDEAANIGQIPRLEKLVATIRSREISACLVLQAQSQLKAIYKDNADTIIGNMDTSIFLGGKEPTTLKELAAVLGKETIDTYNTGESRGRETSHSLNYQKLGKELMSQDELAVMDGGKCILQLRGVRPFLSDKYDITKHPNYPYTADADPKNAFDIEAFLSTRLKLKPNEVYDVYEVDAEGV